SAPAAGSPGPTWPPVRPILVVCAPDRPTARRAAAASLARPWLTPVAPPLTPGPVPPTAWLPRPARHRAPGAAAHFVPFGAAIRPLIRADPVAGRVLFPGSGGL